MGGKRRQKQEKGGQRDQPQQGGAPRSQPQQQQQGGPRGQPQQQQQGAWGSRSSTQTHEPQPPLQGFSQQQSAPRGQPQQQQQGAWGNRSSTQIHEPQPPLQGFSQQQGGPRGQPQQQQQGAWGNRSSTQIHEPQPPLQGFSQQQGGPRGQPQQQQQGAWGSRSSTQIHEPQPPLQGFSQQQSAPRGQPQQQQQGAWGSRSSTQIHEPQPPLQGFSQQQSAPRGQPQQQQQGAWGNRSSTQIHEPQPLLQGFSQQQSAPRGEPQQQQQGAWGSRRSTQIHEPQPPLQGFSQQQGGPRGQPQQQQQGAWGSRSSTKIHEPQPPQLEGKGPEVSSKPESKSDKLIKCSFAERIPASKLSGQPITVATNFYRLLINNPSITVHHYDVVIEPDKPKFLLRAVWNKFVSMMFPNRLTAFDGHNAYSKGPLGSSGNYKGSVSVLNPENNREKEFSVSIQEVRKVSLSCFLNYRERMIKEKNPKVLPEAEVSILEIILKNWFCDNYVSSGRSFFQVSKNLSDGLKLSDRLDMKFGHSQAVFVGYSLYLNFDISHKSFYRCSPVLDVLNCFRHRYDNSLDVNGFEHFMKNVKIEYQMPNDPGTRRVFRVNKLLDNADTTSFEREDGSKITVAEYFATEKKYRLKYPDMPVLWVGPTQKSIYLPMELCRIIPDQVFKKEMNPFETRKMLENCTTDAITRQKNITSLFNKLKINNHPLLKEFGLNVSNEMERVPARILDPPQLATSGTSVFVKEGVWRIKNFLKPVTLSKWCILNTDRGVRRENLMELQNMIKNRGKDFNMQISDPRRDALNVDPSFAGLKKAFSQLKDMEMVFVIISEAKGLYSRVKTICETQEGILTQCVKSKTVNQDPRKLATTVQNILLKVNAKLGGTNITLNKNSFPECLNGYVMIVGADVTHSSPGMKIPSVAAVAVSCDAAAFQYGITTRIQPKGEMIIDLQEIISIHLKRFYELRKRYPEKIIFFRDGVSEGELPKVFSAELRAVKNACGSLCQPKITFLIVQKRIHARFFPTRREDEQGKNFNVPVGTCVDSHIVHPRDLDFYLVSHASILGTARPTRYRLLHDDNKLTDNEIENLSYYLCHLFARCNRSVSYPSPTYNAHLAAFRARAYLEGLNVTDDKDLVTVQKKMSDKISQISPMFFV